MTDAIEPEKSGISRRTVTKAMAWAVPAIAIAAPVPAFAASGDGPTGVFISACKQPGNSCNNDYGFIKGYTFVITITNTNPGPIYIYPTNNGTVDPEFELTSDPPKNFSYNTARRYTGDAIGVPLTTAEQIAGNNGTLQIIVNAGINSNSANISATGGLYMAWGHTTTPGADPDHDYSSTAGSGYFFIPIDFASTPPCGTDCAPGGDESETPA